VDTRTIKWIINSIKKGQNLVVEVQQFQLVESNIQNLDALLRRLTHKQVRVLLTTAITKHTPQIAGKMSEKIRAFFNENRTLKQSAKEDNVNTQPYGFGIKPSEALPTENDENNTNANNDLTEEEKQALMPPPPPPPPGLLEVVAERGRLKQTPGGVNVLNSDLEEALKARKQKATTAKKAELKKTLLAEEILPGSRIFLTDKRSWIDNLVRTMVRNYDMMHVVYKIVAKSDISVKKATELLEGGMNQDVLVKVMTECGFTVSLSRWKVETAASLKAGNSSTEKPTEEIQYEFIITPYPLPRWTVLQIIQTLITINRNGRVGGALVGSVDKLLVNHREKRKKEEEAKGDVVRGFWSRKEKVQIKSVWDD